MSRYAFTMVLLIVAVGMVGLTGCGEDPKQRIALLEGENQQLMDDLARAREEAERAQRDANDCESILARLRSDNASLAARISDLQSAPPPAQPQPQVPQGWTAVPGGAMIAIPGEVLFQSGKATLRSEAQRVLDQVVSAVNSQYSDKDVLVYGHTDDVPIKKSGWKDNFELSSQRALSVVRHLESRGVNAKRLVACGCGEHRPVVPNSSAGNRSKNRRVEIFALDASVRR